MHIIKTKNANIVHTKIFRFTYLQWQFFFLLLNILLRVLTCYITKNYVHTINPRVRSLGLGKRNHAFSFPQPAFPLSCGRNRRFWDNPSPEVFWFPIHNRAYASLRHAFLLSTKSRFGVQCSLNAKLRLGGKNKRGTLTCTSSIELSPY